jgi:hypothetical protein
VPRPYGLPIKLDRFVDGSLAGGKSKVKKVSRRTALAGAGAVITQCCCPSLVKSTNIADETLCATNSPFGLIYDETFHSTGNPSLDASLVAELSKQSMFFGHRPGFVLYNSSSKNASASKKPFPLIPDTDSTIFYHLGMHRDQLNSGVFGGAIVAGVIAHEFGHIYQYFANYIARLQYLDWTQKFVELHADYLSGFYMAGKELKIEIKPYTDAFFLLGDYDFTSPTHHGTPEERYAVLQEGYNFRLQNPKMGLDKAAAAGETWLKIHIRRSASRI